MPRPGGNPDIKNYAHLGGAGAKTMIAKLKKSLKRPGRNPEKYPPKVNPNSMVGKAVKFDGSKEALQRYNNFVNFVLSQPLKTLTEIQRLEGVLAMAEANFTKILDKLEKGEELSDKDRKDMFLVKDTLVDLHKARYGEKKLNVTASYKDIRDAMFEE